MNDATHYAGLIHAAFPGLNFERTRLVTKGWDNDVLILDDRLVFRFPKRAEYKARFKSEVALLAELLPRLPLAVPDYIYLPDGLSFGGYEKIPGRELLPGDIAAMDRVALGQITAQLGQFLTALHEMPVDIVKTCGFKEEADGYWWSPKNARRILPKIQNRVFPKLTDAERTWIEAQFEAYLALDFDIPTTVIHQDINDDHIFFDPDKNQLTGVIDFADIGFGDPAFDFAELWYYGGQFVEDVLAHYGGAVDEDFLARSKFPRLIGMVGFMLELEAGWDIPITWPTCQNWLAEAMASGLGTNP